MKFSEAIEHIANGEIMCRRNWRSSAGQYKGTDKWYVKLDGQGFFCIYDEENIEKGIIQVTLDHVNSDDWEFVSNTFEIELVALKKKHGR